MTLTRRAALGVAAASLAAPAVRAQTARFPERPVELVVGFAAGGGTDITIRTFARFLEPRLGGPVVVINRPGAGGEVMMASVARARPDGHTLGVVTMPGLLTIPIERTAQFRLEDFAAVALIATDPNAMTVHAQSPYRTVQELIEAARREPDRLNFASSGIGSDDHLQLVLLQQAAGIRMTHVTYPGSAQVRSALLGRQVDVVGMNVGEIMGAPENMRMLVQAGPARSRFAPQVPTFRELGLPIEMASDRGVVAPAATPPAVLARLREAFGAAAQDPEFARALEAQFTEVRYIPGEAWGEQLRALRESYRALWERAPWRER
ncbi:tripartite tricarboxylate transporter substrate binding protein [Caldovatus aquaticus]|uniref:Tripartite tricarboxylate transporter substrate binding protein n=1 Tax=Caldovatus aquaticus TaxID=2865671 RepID=A0ABS7EXA1_9PROT|nr:tripartite tricarboxylate transporter substrate binding protein [Caldovatus aquaticus]MBW8267995.1 tripartite tricarboxylate transporter substrate binding protein [Caldovatus aquaticus]